MKTMKKIVAILAVAMLLCSILPLSVFAAEESVTYTFSDYKDAAASKEQGYTKALDDTLSISLYGTNTSGVGYFAAELRIYQSNYAVLTSTKNISVLVLNMGNKNGTMNVYTSADGSEWSADQSVAYTSAYADQTVTLATASKFVKLEFTTAQARIKTMTVTYVDGGSDAGCDHQYDYACSQYCNICGARSNPSAECVNANPICIDGQCTYCDNDIAGLGHTYDNDYDADCNVCGEIREVGEIPDSSDVTEQDISIIANTGTLVDTTISWESDNFKYYYEKASSTTNIRTSDSDHFRNYQGSQITISGKNGETISVIEITCTTGAYANVLNGCTTNDGWISSVSGSVVTFTATGVATELIITSSAQWRCNNVHIVPYVAGVCNHVWSNCADTDCDLGCGETREGSVCVYTSQYDSACSECGATQSVELPAADSELTIPEANDVAQLGGSNYTSGSYYVTGVVESIANTIYGNLYIQDANGNKLYVYGVYGPDTTTRFDSLGDLQPAVGDEITLYGPLGTYNGTAQMKNGILVVETTVCDECTYSGIYDTTCNVCFTEREVAFPEADSVLSITEAIEIGQGMDHNTYSPNKYYVTGVVTEVYNTQYGNMYITDGENTLTIYGTDYANLEVKPGVGDTVTIYGPVGQYSGTSQIKNGNITEIVAHTCVSDAPACIDGTCSICGAAIAGTGEHEYDDEYDADCNLCGDVREVPEKPVEIVYGDADGDGEVTALDAILLGQFVTGWEVELNEVSADADGDGEVTALDAILLGQFVTGWDVDLGPADENKVFNDGELGEW